jgi:hypothetical protein
VYTINPSTEILIGACLGQIPNNYSDYGEEACLKCDILGMKFGAHMHSRDEPRVPCSLGPPPLAWPAVVGPRVRERTNCAMLRGDAFSHTISFY